MIPLHTVALPSIPTAVCPAISVVVPACQAAGSLLGGSLFSGLASGIASGVASGVVGSGVDAVFGGVTQWVVQGAGWLLGQVGSVLTATTSIDLGARWFTTHYQAMMALLAVVLLPLLLLGVLQAVYRQNASQLLRAALVHLPLALLLTGAAVTMVRLVLSATDSLSGAVAAGSGVDLRSVMSGLGSGLVQSAGVPGAPAFVLLLGALLVALGAFTLWVELLVRAAAVYVAVLFLPLALGSLVWPAISHWCRRLVDTLAALILAKFVIVAILSLAVGALASGSGGGVASVLGGGALLLLASFTPFTLLRLLPVVEAGAVHQLEGARHRVHHAVTSPLRPGASMAMRQLRTEPFPDVTPGTGLDVPYEPAGVGLPASTPGGGGPTGGLASAGAGRPPAPGGGGSGRGGGGGGGGGGEGEGAGGPGEDPLGEWGAVFPMNDDLPPSSIPMVKGDPDAVPEGFLSALTMDPDEPLPPAHERGLPPVFGGSFFDTFDLDRPPPSMRDRGHCVIEHDGLGPVIQWKPPTSRPSRRPRRCPLDPRDPRDPRVVTVAEGPRYRFGPLERRGLIAGWRGGQIASVAGGLIVAVLALRARPTVPGIVVAALAVGASVALACWPVAGRTGEEWLPTVARWSSERAGGAGTHRSPVPGLGHRARGTPAGPADRVDSADRVDPGDRRRPGGLGGPPRRPAHRGTGDGAFAGLRLLQAAGAEGPGSPAAGGAPGAHEPTGVVFDAGAGTYTAVMSVRGHSFSLLGPLDKERRVNGWAAVLGALGRQGSLVHRLQWVASTLPDDGRGVRDHLHRRSELDGDDPARRSYVELLDEAGPRACRHEVLLCVQIAGQRRTARAIRAAGGGRAGACAVLLREVDALRGLLADADVLVESTLSPEALAVALRRRTEPAAGAADHADRGPSAGGAGRSSATAAERWPWPMAVENQWGEVRTDGTWHRTYWVAEWPRVEVGPDFLGPLLLGTARRSVAVVMEPVSPLRAARQVEQARTADLADAELRRRGGFLSTARRSREAEQVTQRESELADGHASYRFSGYVTVTAPSLPALDQAGEATEQAAGQARLEVRRLYGDQERALTCTLPLGRGLS